MPGYPWVPALYVGSSVLFAAAIAIDAPKDALATASRAFALYDVLGNPTHDLSGENVRFTPGSAAIRILDPATRALRDPVTADYVRFAKLVAGLPHLAAQSTAFVPSDVPPPESPTAIGFSSAFSTARNRSSPGPSPPTPTV